LLLPQQESQTESRLTCSLYFPTGQGGLVADATQLGSLNHDAVKHVHSKGLHDLHALLGNANIWVNFFQYSALAQLM